MSSDEREHDYEEPTSERERLERIRELLKSYAKDKPVRKKKRNWEGMYLAIGSAFLALFILTYIYFFPILQTGVRIGLF